MKFFVWTDARERQDDYSDLEVVEADTVESAIEHYVNDAGARDWWLDHPDAVACAVPEHVIRMFRIAVTVTPVDPMVDAVQNEVDKDR